MKELANRIYSEFQKHCAKSICEECVYGKSTPGVVECGISFTLDYLDKDNEREEKYLSEIKMLEFHLDERKEEYEELLDFYIKNSNGEK